MDVCTKKILDIPHTKEKGTCYINGLNDILLWHGTNYNYFLLPIIGGMAGFAYLKYNKADVSKMVYWGNNTKFLLAELSSIINYNETIIENKSWKSTFSIIKQELLNNKPVIAGALDMYHLPYYKDIFHNIHVPIHYILLTGFDDSTQTLYVNDCSFASTQKISYTDLENALNNKVPGMSKKNTIRKINLPEKMPDEEYVLKKGIKYKSNRMLNPPVNIIGIPAMKKLEKDIISMDKKCLKHLAAYAGNNPPVIPENINKCNGLRFKFSDLLTEYGKKYNNVKYTKASFLFKQSGNSIINLCKNALNNNLQNCCKDLKNIINFEEEAYELLQ